MVVEEILRSDEERIRCERIVFLRLGQCKATSTRDLMEYTSVNYLISTTTTELLVLVVTVYMLGLMWVGYLEYYMIYTVTYNCRDYF